MHTYIPPQANRGAVRQVNYVMTTTISKKKAGGSRTRAGVLAGAVTAVLSLVLASCSSGSASSNPAATATVGQSGKLTGNLTLSVYQFTSTIIAPVLKAFEAANPKLHVKESIYNGAESAYLTSLLTQKLAGNLPDLVDPADIQSSELMTDGITQNLSPYLAKGEPYKQSYWLANILSSYIPSTGPHKGQVFGLPNQADALVVYYNKDEFKAAGVPYPTNNWTWSQMMADAAKLKVVKGGTQTQWGLCEDPNSEYYPLMKALGLTSLSETKADLASPVALKAWQMLISPTQNGEALPYATLLSAQDNCATPFESGQASMYFGVRGSLPTLRPALAGKFKWDVLPMPFVQGPHGSARPTQAGSVGWSLSSQAKDTSNALAFLRYLFSSKGQAIMEKGYGAVPAIPSLLSEGSLWQKLPGPPYNVSAYKIAAQSGFIAPKTPSTVYNAVQTDVPKAIEAVLDEHQSYAQAFGDLDKTINALYPKS
jgi:multiple sugar transport system substrate-binding protein